jgi:hypothetical protein
MSIGADAATHNAGDALGVEANGDAVDTHINRSTSPESRPDPRKISALTAVSRANLFVC